MSDREIERWRQHVAAREAVHGVPWGPVDQALAEAQAGDRVARTVAVQQQAARKADADLLRRAALRLRERAWPASRAPWVVPATGSTRVEVPTSSVQLPSGHTVALVPACHSHPNAHRPDADYIAFMHPPVALAMALVFDYHALMVESYAVGPVTAGLRAPESVTDAARAVLREVADAQPCKVCDGARVMQWESGEHGTGFLPCVGCCCEICGMPTQTPPECGRCAIRADTTARRRADR